MTAKWILEYYSNPNWVAFTGKFSQTMKEQKGHEQADIILPNTSSNRTLVGSDQTVRIKYDTHEVFTGALNAVDYTASQLKCVLYNDVYEKMKAKTITQDFAVGTQASTILAAICAAAGVTAGSCPNATLGVEFIDAECYMAVCFLTDILNSDYNASSNTFNIAARGSLRTASHYKIQSRGIDRAKLRDKVRVRGVDIDGQAIVGEAGIGTNVKVYIEQKVSDQATLNLLASKYLSDLNTSSQGAPLIFPIDESYNFEPGDTFAVTNPRYNLAGTYPMKRVTKTSTKVTVELDVMKKSLEQIIVDFSKYEEFGIYYKAGSATGVTSTVLSFQSLELYQLLDEGSDIYIADYSPKWRQGIGYHISWVDSAVGKICTFNGIDSFINEGSDFDAEGTDKLTVMAWITPAPSVVDDQYIIYRDNFKIVKRNDNSVSVGIVTGGSWSTQNSGPNQAPDNTRTFVALRYDGAHLSVFINGKNVAEKAQTGTLDWVSWMPMVAGAMTAVSQFYKGGIDHLAIFSRALADEELMDVYNYNGIITPPSNHPVNNLDITALEALWHCNEGADLIITDVINKYQGMMSGTTWYQGPVAPLLHFVAGNYVDCGAGLDLAGTSQISFGGWVSPVSIGTSQNYIMYKGSQFELRLYNDQVWASIGNTTCTAQFQLAQANERMFVMATYDGTNIIVYVNGTERARNACTGNIAVSTSNLYLGAKSTGQMSLRGYLAEVMVWSRTLSPEEVAMLYFFPLTQVLKGGTRVFNGPSWTIVNPYDDVAPRNLVVDALKQISVSLSVNSDLTLDLAKTPACPMGAPAFTEAMTSFGKERGLIEITPANTIDIQQGSPAIPMVVDGNLSIDIPKTPLLPMSLNADLAVDIDQSKAITFTVEINGIDNITDYYANPLTYQIFGNYELVSRQHILVGLVVDSDVFKLLASGAESQLANYQFDAEVQKAGLTNVAVATEFDAEIPKSPSNPLSNTNQTEAYPTVDCLVENYRTSTSYDYPITAVWTGSVAAVGQTFNGVGTKLSSCKFLLYKLGSPVGNLKARLYAHTGSWGSGYPTGAVLAQSTNAIAMAALTTTPTLTTFTFDETYALVAGTKYCIVLYCDSASTINGSNCPYVGGAYYTQGYHPGNFVYYPNAWSYDSARDIIFYVIGHNI